MQIKHSQPAPTKQPALPTAVSPSAGMLYFVMDSYSTIYLAHIIIYMQAKHDDPIRTVYTNACSNVDSS